MMGDTGPTVLVTSAGSAPAVAVIQALIQQQEIGVRVVAADMDLLSAGFHLAHQQVMIPGAAAPGFITEVLEACRQCGATVVFPIIDEELQLFADSAPTFEAEGIQVVTNPPEVVRLAKDKWLAFQWCQQQKIRTPRTWRPESRDSTFPYPLIAKPRSGRGSAGVELVRCERDLEYQLGRGENLILQEYIDGPEFTVDILTDDKGRVLSAVPRERLLTKAGMCVKGRTVNRPHLLNLSVQIAETFGLAPRGNVQLKQSRHDGEYYLIEFNPKFGAGLPLTTAAGVNMPLLILKMLRGDVLAPMLGQFQSNLVMLRHWAEIFVPAAALSSTC